MDAQGLGEQVNIDHELGGFHMTLETWNVISMSPHWFHLALLLCQECAMRIMQA